MQNTDSVMSKKYEHRSKRETGKKGHTQLQNTEMNPKLRKGDAFLKEYVCNWPLPSVQKLDIRCIEEMLKDPLRCVRIYKDDIFTKGQQRHTTNMLLQLPWAWIHGLVRCSFKFFLCFIFTFFLQPKVFQVISVLP